MDFVDTWILERGFQPLTDWLTKQTGRTSLWYGRQLVCLSLILMFGCVYTSGTPIPIFMMLCGVFYALSFYYVYRRAERIEKEFFDSPNTETNPFYHDFKIARVFAVFLLVMQQVFMPSSPAPFLLLLWPMLFCFSHFLTVFVLSCQPLIPPTKRSEAWKKLMDGGLELQST